jgi:hypothetical protein
MKLDMETLSGAWKLVRVVCISAAGRPTYPFGHTHLLIYTSDGWMAAAIAPDRNDAGAQPPVHYAGRAEIVNDDHIVHTVIAGVAPCEPGNRQRRVARLSSPDRLFLCTVDDDVTQCPAEFLWLRLSPPHAS